MKSVELFSSNLCPYCRKTKQVLNARGIPFTERKITMIAGVKLRTHAFKEMKRRSGGKTTVPQIFVDGKYYGDDDTLDADITSGRIKSVFGI